MTAVTFLDELMRQLPLKGASIPKGGANREGLTWDEWEAAARWTGAKPANMYEGGQWAHAWAHGVDPTEMYYSRIQSPKETNMIEVPCTLRCDRCGHATQTVAETKHVMIPANDENDATHAFVITEKVMPANWCMVYGGTQCPRCNGVK